MFRIVSAQRYEVLEQLLLNDLMHPRDHPFVEDQVLIPSAAIQRRLTFAIADRFGICSRVGFSFVATWLWQQTIALLKDFPERSPFDVNTLRWRIFRHFENGSFLASHPRLQAYLEHADPLMRFDLACQVAALFDQYTTFRADWLEAWAAGRLMATRSDSGDARADERWQSDLWRVLIQEIGEQFEISDEHPSQLFLKVLGERDRNGSLPDAFRQPVHVFFLPSLPPLYLSWLRGIAAYRDVILYVIDPCQEYWHDLIPAREWARKQVSGELDYQEVGHRLLTSWGRQTQAYVQLLMSQEGELDVELPTYAEAETAEVRTLLSALQKSIYTLQDLTEGSLYHQVQCDGSIQIHSCHSLTRELEVLQDCLLARFKEPNPPRPSDILVVVPDLDQAAPLIEGVFGHPPKDCAIPYVISGVAPITVSPCAQSVLAILKMARSRLTLGEVIETLRLPLIADAVGLPLDEVDTLAEWLKKANVRWGLASQHRIELGLPSSARHTFEDGLDRLFLGYALPENFEGLWQGQIAVESVEGMEAHYLAAFAVFVDHIQNLHLRLQSPLTAKEWSTCVDEVLKTFIKPNMERAQELQSLTKVLMESEYEMADAMPIDTAIPVDVLMRAFEEALQGRAKGGMPTGSVTFAAMPSLRGVPHRFVCVLGLNDQVFPSPNRKIEFDLIAHAPRYGDRQRQHDERNLFLDLILSARENLHLSYVGKDRRDNSVLPPSVLLAELLDAIIPALCSPHASKEEKEKIRQTLTVEHPLQAFSELYFEHTKKSSSMISFRKRFAQALTLRAIHTSQRVQQEQDKKIFDGSLSDMDIDAEGEVLSGAEQELDRLAFGVSAPFYDSLMREPLEPEWRSVSLDQLIRFIQNPVRFYLTQRLGIELPHIEKVWPETEDFEPTYHAERKLAERLLPALLTCPHDIENVLSLAQAGREFPEGLGGHEALTASAMRIHTFALQVQVRLNNLTQHERQGCLLFHLGEGDDKAEWTLNGALHSLYGDHQIRYGFGGLTERQVLEIWCRHLFLCASADESEQWNSEWLSSEGNWILTAVSKKEALKLLQDLLGLYFEGLNSPLHFFPQSAWAYVEAEENNPGSGLKEAMKTWMPSRFKTYAEGANPEYRLAFRGRPTPLDEAFENLAQRVLHPVMQHLHHTPLNESQFNTFSNG